MASHYTWGSVTTLQHDFGGVLGRPLDTFFWALTTSRSQLLARVPSTYLLGGLDFNTKAHDYTAPVVVDSGILKALTPRAPRGKDMLL